ncbi:MAG: hypothetical protein KIS92_00120 [Planctomycetota bacterium]|nr:hypothetical protein [Planctomycetota bacterium]
MNRRTLLPVILLAASACAGAAGGLHAEEAPAVLDGGVLQIGGKTIKLEKEKDLAKFGKAILAAGGEALKGKDASLKLSLGEKARWADLQRVLLAAAAVRVRSAGVSAGTEAPVVLDLPGADGQNGEVVDLPLSRGAKGELRTETGGQSFQLDADLVKGLVQQAPGAVVNVVAPADLPARDVLRALKLLKDASAKAAYLPHKALAEAQPAGGKNDSEEHESGASRMAKGLSE